MSESERVERVDKGMCKGMVFLQEDMGEICRESRES